MSELAPYRPGLDRLRYRSIRAALLVALALDLVMAIGKGLYGYLSGSLGMVSDGLHSALHASGGIIGLIGVWLAARPPDPGAPDRDMPSRTRSPRHIHRNEAALQPGGPWPISSVSPPNMGTLEIDASTAHAGASPSRARSAHVREEDFPCCTRAAPHC